MQTQTAVLWDIADEHFDEAEFLFEQWLVAVRSPRLSLRELQRTIERRLEAHLDALSVGGEPVASQLLWPAFDEAADEPAARVTTAALALLRQADRAIVDRLVDLFRNADAGPLSRGLRHAFQLTSYASLDEPLRLALYAAEKPAARAGLLEVLASRRVDPGPILGTLLGRSEPRELAFALRGAAAGDRARLRHLVEGHLVHGESVVREAALRTALIWNLATGWRACGQAARSGSPEAMLALAMLGGPRELSLVLDGLRSADRRKHALFALGFSGRQEAVEACLPFLDDPDPKVASLAVEAIAGITNLPLFDPPFALPAEDEGEDLPPLEDDLPRDLSPMAHDELPRPNAPEIRRWWSERRSSFAAGQRYLRGAAFSPAAAQAALVEGALRRTGPLAYELAVRSGGRVQLAAFRLGYASPTVPADAALGREPGWH